MIDFDLRLQSDRLLLRPVEAEDIGLFEPLTRDRSMWIYFTSDLSVREELVAWVDTALKQREQKTRLALTVIDRSENIIMGSSSFGNFSERDRRVEIGWTWLGKEYQGRGINAQVKRLMLAYCFETIGIERVEFKTDVLNAQARRALANVGLVEEGVLRSHTLMTRGRRRDTIFYSGLKSEWPAMKNRNGWT